MLVIYKHKNNKSIIYFARKVWIYQIRILWRKSKERQKKNRKRTERQKMDRKTEKGQKD